jgi:hypothetical protein
MGSEASDDDKRMRASRTPRAVKTMLSFAAISTTVGYEYVRPGDVTMTFSAVGDNVASV